MKRKSEGHAVTLQRTIQASPAEVYEAWLDPTAPACPFHGAARLILDARVDGLFFWLHRQDDGSTVPHYGRFTALDRGRRIQHTWVSEYTRGLESVVTIALEPSGRDTAFTLHHDGLPDEDSAKAHREGWTFFVDRLRDARRRG